MPRLSQTLRFLQSPSFRQTVYSDWPTDSALWLAENHKQPQEM